MSANELAKRYGQALLTLAEEQSIQRQVADELKALVALIGRERLLKDCLANPTIPVAAKQAILDQIMAPAFNPLTRGFVGLLVRNRRAALLAELVQFLETRLDEKEGRVEVRVESALPMTDADHADFLRRLTQWLNKKVELKIAVVPELLAGITIRIGDHLIDGSCRGQLTRMRQVLMA
ncbi:MAG: ATP synthase F1 subunit delta [Verrucomicrobia bacterium]|nr:ATP synthase F1 subunit delta [Verrucomicrobiota bacterium]MBU1736473.1 ATP synthase F1 subunit delta [Verrucomicrobiota bacterium]MBU1857240.1 ATP synthase F1 subunit delta [Verrucomicrobiota bacterium]